MVDAHAKGGWSEPTTPLDPEATDIRAVRGRSIIVARAVALSLIGPEEAIALRAELSEPAKALLDQAPAPDDWCPVEVAREFFGWAQRHARGGLAGPVARFNAERDAGGGGWTGRDGSRRVLPGTRPEDLLASLQTMYAEYFRGGTARVEGMEPGQAWVSLWTHELFPGWAEVDLPEWFRRAWRNGYGLALRVTYVPSPSDRPWWHRYHLDWRG